MPNMPVRDQLAKHHYIPVFYLKEWTRPDGRLTEFSRPTGDQVIPRRTSPKGTGYVRGLYRLDGPNEEASEAFERVFFSQVDNLAKEGLDMMLQRIPPKWTIKVRWAWSRFVIGMMFRNPERLAATRRHIEEIALRHWEAGEAEYNAKKDPNDPEFLEFLLRQVAFNAVDWTTDIMENENIGRHIVGMRWSVRNISDSGMTLFTSDRPILMTNGLAGDEGHLIMPISPVHAFVACSSEGKEKHLLHEIPSPEFARAINRNILRFAQKYAWHSDDTYINRAKEHLSVEKHIPELFFAGAPNRALQKFDDAEA